ncbi:MAG: hypothetical protein ACRDL5_05445 [Solirubrobacteraceae bacterium]
MDDTFDIAIEKPAGDYERPRISKDYGDLKELTASREGAGITDSPRYTRGPVVFC